MQCTLYSCPILLKLEISRHIFEKYSNISFHETPSRGRRFVPCGRTDGRADITKLIAAFRNFANARQTLQILHVFFLSALRYIYTYSYCISLYVWLPSVCQRKYHDRMVTCTVTASIRFSSINHSLIFSVLHTIQSRLLTYLLTYLLHGAESFLRS